ncbi:MAG: hypothetical protein Q8M94_07345 [Ignavibacteria bacterium]|nr:hypothetical protein [Ignavibacteria bacterium]
MRIRLIFDDWRKKGESVFSTEEGIKLFSGDFYSGTTFNGKIQLDRLQEEKIRKAINEGYQPVFWITK